MMNLLKYVCLLSALFVLTVCTRYKTELDLVEPFEMNSRKFMALIMRDRFQEVEAFVSYVVDQDLRTRDGISYFRAMLGFWFNDEERPGPFPEEALGHLNKWVETSSGSPYAYITRGAFYIDYAFHASGNATTRNELLDPRDLFSVRMAKAEDDLLTAYELDHRNPHSTLQLMRIELGHSQRHEIQEGLFRQVVSLAPESYWAHKIKLISLIPDEGESLEPLFQFALETASSAPPRTLLPLMMVHAHEAAAASNGNWEAYFSDYQVWNEVQGVYQQIMTDFPDSERWKTEFGSLCYAAGRKQLAKHYWSMAAESDPVNFQTLRSAAQMYQDRKQWGLQELSARRLVDMYPDYALGHTLLGYALCQKKQYQESIQCYTTAIEIEPEKVSYWGNRCFLNNRIGKYHQAVKDCSTAIDLKQDYAYGYKQRMIAYKGLGHFNLAESDHQMYETLTAK